MKLKLEMIAYAGFTTLGLIMTLAAWAGWYTPSRFAIGLLILFVSLAWANKFAEARKRYWKQKRDEALAEWLS